jgi:hypothetical protein
MTESLATRSRDLTPARGAILAPLLLAVGLTACGGGESEVTTESDVPAAWAAIDTTQRLAVLTGFDGPEAVLYDPDQDVYFVSNFTGDPGERDGNGYVSRVAAGNGLVEELRFATGTEALPFHAGRGMGLWGDTLWVADVDGIHGFDRTTGEQLLFVDMTGFEPGFLNDIAVAPDGSAYVTDTGRSAVYRFHPGEPALAIEGEELGGPNGILWDDSRQAFWLAPWSGGSELRLWDPASGDITRPRTTSPAERMDGMVLWDGYLLVASQADSSIHAVSDARTGAYISTRGAPADLGLDTRRGRLAIPEVALDEVEIWQLPGGAGR